MLRATFNGYTFESIEGYRICCSLVPSYGFQDNFFVYIDERRQARTAFDSPPDISENLDTKPTSVRGTLEIFDDDMGYVFRDIDLRHVEYGATRRERTRYFEFAYDSLITGASGADPIKIEGKATPPEASALGADYRAGIGSMRDLLGFRTYAGAAGSTAVRFWNRGCLPDSFLTKVVELNKEIGGGRALLPAFKIRFAQLDFDINKDTLLALVVEESRGSFLSVETPPLSSIAKVLMNSELGRLRYPELDARDILNHDTDNTFRSVQVRPGAVETTTVVFSSAKIHANPKIT
jgi:hypothetical protein